MRRILYLLLVGCVVGCAHTPRSPLNPEQMNKKEDAYLQFVQGSLLAMEGSPDKAVEELEGLLKLFPDNAFFFQLYAETLARAGQETEALTAARRSVEINPRSIDARVLLGKLLMHVDSSEATRVFERVVADAPECEEVYSLLAKLYVDQGHPRQGIEVMRRLLKFNPDTVAAYLNMGSIYEKQLKDPASALAMYREAVRLEPDHLMAHNAIAQIYLDRKDLRNALATYQTIEKLTPSDIGVSLRIALLYYELKDHPHAVEKFTTILAHHPQADKIRFYLGMLYEGIDQKDKALEQFSLIPPTSDSYKEARLHMAEIHRSEKQIDVAIASLEVALRERGDLPELSEYLAALYEDQKKYHEAIEVMVRATKRFPQEERLALFLGFLYEKTRDRERALETMQRVLKINPQNASALNYIGYTYADRNERLDEASHLLEEAVKIRPDDGYIIDSLGWIRFRQGHLDEASTLLEKALRLSPKEPTILYHLGEVRSHQGKSKEALRFFRQSLDAWKKRPDPDADEMSRVQQRLDEVSKGK